MDLNAIAVKGLASGYNLRMKALSLQAPWAWLVIHGGKDVENRTWLTHYRGPIAIHASKKGSKQDYAYVQAFIRHKCLPVILPPYAELNRGGIIGTVELVGCERYHESPWFLGPVAFILARPKPLDFIPYKGQLGLFDVPQSVIYAP